VEPQSHDDPEHPQIAAYAVIGRRMKSVGATANAEPMIAERATNPRRDIFGAKAPASRSTSRTVAFAITDAITATVANANAVVRR
jgi:hypothetical protein